MPTHYRYPDVLPFEDFSSLMEKSALELEVSQSFLLRATIQPMLLFKEANIYLKSPYSLVTAIMNNSYLKKDKVNGHAFQVFLASLLDKGIQSWVKKNGITQEVRVFVRNPSTFPSIFAVYVNEKEVVQFNIFEQWYGIREKFLSAEDLQEQADKHIKSLQEEMEKTRENIKKYVQIKEKPTSMINSPRDIYLVLFKRKNIVANVQKRISSLEKRMEQIKKEMEYEKDNISQQIERHQTKRDYTELITPFFEELSYRLEEENYKLY